MIIARKVLNFARPILNLTVVSALIVIAMVVLIDNGRGRIWASLGPALRGSFPIAFCIGAICWQVMPRVASRAGSLHPLIRWPIYVATMAVCATAGTVVAGLFYYYWFALAGDRAFVDLLIEALKTSIPVTVIAGSIVTIIGTIASH